MGHLFGVIFVLALMAAIFWIGLLVPAALRDWSKNRVKRRSALVGLTVEQQNLLWSLYRAGPALSCAVDPRPAFHACREAGIDEWRMRAFDP